MTTTAGPPAAGRPGTAAGSPRRLSAALRSGSRVAPLELFFDLVFVLALTQCTALMADVPTWQGVAQGLLVLSALWWSWVGYAWLTSVVDPESSLVRLVVAVAMAAFLVAALCVPGAFGGAGVVFALAYAVVRTCQIALFVVASADDPLLRRPVLGLAGPLLFGVAGWRVEPEHFAERHGLILLIALGESVVAIGAGVVPGPDGGVGTDVVLAAVVATVLVVALWWLYFDVVALVAARRLENAVDRRERNQVARDAFSFLHLPMVAGVVLVALGLKKTLGDVGGELSVVPATALLGGAALYLLAHVAFRWCTVHRLSTQRLVAAGVLLAAVPLATEVPAVLAVTGVALLLCALVAFETLRFAELREQLLAHRHAH